MIMAVDIETLGLDARNFIMGCLVFERNGIIMKPEIYYKKEELWNRILDLGEKESKRGKKLKVYGHNHSYDFYGYADLYDRGIKFFSHRPFIGSYYKTIDLNGEKKYKEIVKFLDSWSIFKMPLKDVGNMIGFEKLEMPQELINDETTFRDLTPKKLKEIETYVTRDTQICLMSILEAKRLINELGVNIKTLYTINQIAVSVLINKLANKKENEYMFYDLKLRKLKQTMREKEIHAAYRGGRVECFKTGNIKNVNYIDCNSLYPYATTLMRFPDISSERKVNKPLEIYSRDELLHSIGVSKALVFNRDCEIGLLPIRTENGNYFPKKGKYLVGVWTNLELEKAVTEGYEIEDIEWTVKFNEAPNPLKEITEELYTLRMQSENKVNNYFYKMLMNASYGKLAQTRVGNEYVIEDIEAIEKYLNNKFQIINMQNYMVTLVKNHKDPNIRNLDIPKAHLRKSYYAPIIPTLTNAWSRCFMFDKLKKIKKEDLVYTDTDSILFIGDYFDKFRIGKNIGEFKVVHKNEDICVYGRKTYCIGKDIKVAGIRLRNIEVEDFKKGNVKSKRMVTISTAKNIEDVGGFIEEERDLNKQLMNYNLVTEAMGNEKIFIDSDITDVSYFLNKINRII